MSLDIENISAVSTKWPEQTFLCGVIAGLGTLSDMEKANEDNVVGVILGMDQPTLRKGLAGFASGVRYVNPDAEILQATIGAFNDPSKGKEVAMSMYNRGADFVQHIVGASGLGVFAAAKDSNIVLSEEILATVEEIKVMVQNGELIPCEDIDKIDEWTAVNQYNKQ